MQHKKPRGDPGASAPAISQTLARSDSVAELLTVRSTQAGARDGYVELGPPSELPEAVSMKTGSQPAPVSASA